MLMDYKELKITLRDSDLARGEVLFFGVGAGAYSNLEHCHDIRLMEATT